MKKLNKTNTKKLKESKDTILRDTTIEDASSTIFKNDENEKVYGSILNFDQ